MTVIRHEHGELLTEYVKDQDYHLRGKFGCKEDYLKTYADEPASPMVTEVHTEIVDVLNPDDPIAVKLVTTVRGKLSAKARALVEALDELHIPWREAARSGGSHLMGVKGKRVKNWREKPELVERIRAIYQTPEWQHSGLAAMDAFLRFYVDRDIENLAKVVNQPELLTIGKPEGTGTGFSTPCNTLGDLAKHVVEYEPFIKAQLEEDIRDQREAIFNVYIRDNQDAMILLQQPGMQERGAWSPLSGGRSDVDVEESTITIDEAGDMWLTQVHISQVREIANNAGSPFHSKGTDTRIDVEHALQSIKTEYTKLPTDREAMAIVLTTKPATMPGDDPEEWVWVSGDAGVVEHPAQVAGLRLVLVDHGATLGADQGVMNGIQTMAAGSRKRVVWWGSGKAGTMWIHEVTFGHHAAGHLRRLQIPPQECWCLRVGDDSQWIMKRKHLPAFMEAIGQYMKLKGMRVVDTPTGKIHSVFCLGILVNRPEDRPDEIITCLIPRTKRTVSSAKRANFELPPEAADPHIGTKYVLYPSEESVKATEENWDLFPELAFFHGTIDAFKQFMSTRYERARAAWAKSGFSEYVTDVTIGTPTDEAVSEWLSLTEPQTTALEEKMAAAAKEEQAVSKALESEQNASMHRDAQHTDAPSTAGDQPTGNALAEGTGEHPAGEGVGLTQAIALPDSGEPPLSSEEEEEKKKKEKAALGIV